MYMRQSWYMKSDEDKSMFCTLLVDANANYREALTDILYAYFPLIDVVEAGNGAEALGKVEYYRPSIIFMDTQLADKSGLDLIKDIKLICGDIVIVILSNNTLPEYLHLAFSYGADFYIPKREDNCMEEILSQIDAAMAIRLDH
jgi:DNA-binding NarL/FixJ family response regulator